MNNNNEIKTNKIIFECMISLKSDTYDILLSLTEKNLLFEKKKGLFHKKYKIVNDILITDIKVVNDKVQIKQSKNKIIIYTRNDEIYFTCESVIEAKKLVEEINKLILGENFLDRTVKKGVKVLNVTKNVAKAVGLVAVATAGAYKAIKANKKVLKETAKTITNFIKK